MGNGRGSTLVELAVAIGVLAAFPVPRPQASVERSRAAEAFDHLSTIQASHHHAPQGTYADDSMIDDLAAINPMRTGQATSEPSR